MSDTASPTPDQIAAAFVRLRERAAAADLPGTLDALGETRLLESLPRQLGGMWPYFKNELDLNEFVGKALAVLCQRLEDRRPVEEPEAFLLKTADHIADREWRRRKREEAVEPSELAARPAHVPQEGDLREAIAAARERLPQLGGANIQAVMGYIIDAVEQGREHIPSTEIADALGLEDATVRQLRKRGFDRLHRIMLEAAPLPEPAGDDD